MNFSKEEVVKILDLLEEEHKNAECELNYSSSFELLVAVILSAQCTDKRVNIVTKDLFKIASTPIEFVNLEIEELEKLIKPCGFFRNKAKNIKACAAQLVNEYNSVVPESFEELIKLAGVGRKTANVMCSVAFNKQAIAVDTHVLRLSNRIGFIKSDSPLKVEEKLQKIIPKDRWSESHHLLIHHGRYTCKAISPNCKECSIKDLCKYRSKKCF